MRKRSRHHLARCFATVVALYGLLTPHTTQGSTPRSATGQQTSSPASGDPDWLIYKNDRVEVAYPKSWRVVSHDPYGDLVEFSPPIAEKSLSSFGVGPFQPIRASWFRDFNQWVRDIRRRMTRAGDTILAEESLRVSGYPAVRITYRNNLPNSPTPTVIDLFIGVPGKPAGQVFQLVYIPPNDRASRREQDRLYERVVSSLKISAQP